MRIFLVNERWDAQGGSEAFLLSVILALKERGHTLRLCVAYAASDAPPLPPDIELVTFPWSGVRERSNRGTVALVCEAARSFAPDVIYAHNVFDAGVVEGLRRSWPFVWHDHDHRTHCLNGNRRMTRTGRICSARMGSACAVRALTQRCGAGCDLKSLDLLQIRARLLTSLRYAERVVVFGSYLRQTLIKNGFNPARISIVPPFSRYAVNGASSHYPQSTQQTRQILFASRLTTDKGVDDALWLAAILGRSGRNVRMLVAGDGPLAPLVVKAAREPGSRVEYRGKLGTTELSQALAESSFVVMPSLWPEPFGLIGLEALAHGRPVIAYRSGGIPDWLAHYKSGILVNVGDRAALLTAAYQLLDDPSLAESLGIEGARQVRHRFSLETSLDALENVLHDAIQQRSHEPGKSASNVAAMANAQ